MRIGGYAAIFNSTYQLGQSSVFERVLPGAFTRSLEAGDVVALYQHNKAEPLGRRSASTLDIWQDERGLGYEIELPKTRTAEDVAELVLRGDIRGSSIGFNLPPGGSRGVIEDGKQIRELTEIDLREVSVVTFPANPEAFVGMRADDTTEGELVLRALERDRRRRAVLLLADV